MCKLSGEPSDEPQGILGDQSLLTGEYRCGGGFLRSLAVLYYIDLKGIFSLH